MQRLINILDTDFHRWLVKYPLGVFLIVTGFVLDAIIAIPFAPICWWEGRARQVQCPRKDEGGRMKDEKGNGCF